MEKKVIIEAPIKMTFRGIPCVKMANEAIDE